LKILSVKLKINNLLDRQRVATTLAWVTGKVERWKSFVANRIREIQENIPNANWRYVNTKENPADLLSRDYSIIAEDTRKL